MLPRVLTRDLVNTANVVNPRDFRACFQALLQLVESKSRANNLPVNRYPVDMTRLAKPLHA